MGFKQVATALTVGVMAVVALPSLAAAASSTQVIIQEDVARQPENSTPTKNWVEYFRTAVSEASFRVGPSEPPLNTGSMELTTPTGGDKITVFNFDHVGTELSDIDAMKYSTYRSAGSAQQDAAINIQVDFNGAAVGGFTTLVFEPVYNTDQGAVTSGAWQDWDAYNGGNAIWWSSNPIPSAPNRDTFVSWDTIMSANPGATILGGYGVNQGSGNPGLTTAVDALALGVSGDTVTYDFEAQRVAATSKDQCKNEGYKNFSTEYKNQGDCVSAIASDGKAKGNPKPAESPMDSFLRAIGL
ncbi:MAG: hypothetical protein V4678_04360 [Patescibacteria group bacterium]